MDTKEKMSLIFDSMMNKKTLNIKYANLSEDIIALKFLDTQIEAFSLTTNEIKIYKIEDIEILIEHSKKSEEIFLGILGLIFVILVIVGFAALLLQLKSLLSLRDFFS